MTDNDIWAYPRGSARLTSIEGADLVGYSVEALDGGIGKVDEATLELGSGYLVVDTGPWIFGKKVVLPAGIIDDVDVEQEAVYVHRSKEQIKSAPELGDSGLQEEGYRDRLGAHYGHGGAGWARR